jgi:hypothetical protein
VLSTKDVVDDLKKIAHAFVIQVGKDSGVSRFWADIYGRDRVVVIPTVEYLPEVEAAIIGLTEGTLTLQTLERFLTEHSENITAAEAKSIKEVVAGIPIGAQAMLPNFGKIPMKGAVFASKTDIWPMDAKASAKSAKSMKPAPAKKPAGAGSMWK